MKGIETPGSLKSCSGYSRHIDERISKFFLEKDIINVNRNTKRQGLRSVFLISNAYKAIFKHAQITVTVYGEMEKELHETALKGEVVAKRYSFPKRFITIRSKDVKRELTEEQKAELAERLSKAR